MLKAGNEMIFYKFFVLLAYLIHHFVFQIIYTNEITDDWGENYT